MVLADFPLHRGGNHRSRLSTASRYPVPVPLEISAPERRIHGIHGTSPSNVRNQRRPHFWPRTLEHFTSSSWDWMRTAWAEPAELLRAWQKEDQWGLEGDFSSCRLRHSSQVPEASSNSATGRADQLPKSSENPVFDGRNPNCWSYLCPLLNAVPVSLNKNLVYTQNNGLHST